MCFTLSCGKDWKYVQTRFDVQFEEPAVYKPFFYEGAFDFPVHPVITDEEPGYISFLNWGLIPSWVKDPQQADVMRRQTINARSDTIFEKPSFRKPILSQRCLIIADGFFEWHDFGSKKYPYYIRMRDKEAFGIAGIWDRWVSGGTETRTFSLITTDANPLMAMVHNTKKRMPVILQRDDEKKWLDKGLSRDEIKSMLSPYEDRQMEAYTVSRLITSKDQDRNVAEVIAPHPYPELEASPKPLF
jgi:putative SOS response-associated peptidase YedK